MSEEYFDIYDKDGNPTGEKASRNVAHKLGLWHRSVNVWLLDGANRLLIQKRAPQKDTFPNRWDASCAGHVDAGEDPGQTAIRELEEELGLIAKPGDLEYLFTVKNSQHVPERYTDNEHSLVYLWRVDSTNLTFSLQAEEVSEVTWTSISSLELDLAENPEKYSPRPSEYPILFQRFSENLSGEDSK